MVMHLLRGSPLLNLNGQFFRLVVCNRLDVMVLQVSVLVALQPASGAANYAVGDIGTNTCLSGSTRILGRIASAARLVNTLVCFVFIIIYFREQYPRSECNSSQPRSIL